MAQNQLNWTENLIGDIADEVLQDLNVRGKYRCVILPMIARRSRLDVVLEPSKAVFDAYLSSHQQLTTIRDAGPAAEILASGSKFKQESAL